MVPLETVLSLLRTYRYAAMSGILFVSAMGVPIPEEAILIAAGLGVGWEQANYWLAAAACVLGIVGGDIYLYLMGRYCGPWFLRRRLVRKVFSEKRQEWVRRFFERHGSKAVFFGRFIAGVRFGVFLYAGQHRMSPVKFILLDLSGALISGPLTILVGSFAARRIAEPEKAAEFARGIIQQGHGWIYALIGLIVLAGIVRWLLGRRAARKAASGGCS